MNYFSPELRAKVIRIDMGIGVLFVLLSTIAIFTYPGGTATQPEVPHYLFFRNFFSDLGRTHDFKGNPQWLTCMLFNGATFLIGCAFLAFYRVHPGSFGKGTPGRALAEFGSLGGALAGICLIGVALTPWDLHREIHMSFVKMGLVAFLVSVMAYSRAIWVTPYYNRIYFWLYILFLLILIFNMYLLFAFNYEEIEMKWTLQAIGQKILGYSQIIVMVIQARGAMLNYPPKSTDL